MSHAWRDIVAARAPWACVHAGASSTVPVLPALRDLLAWHVRHPSSRGTEGDAVLFASTPGHLPWMTTADPAFGTRLALDADACNELYGHMAGHADWLAARRVVERSDVQATTIDTWAAEAGVREIALLSLSLEGGELDALRGADALLHAGHIDVVRTAVVLRPLHHEQPTFTDVDGVLVPHGYRLVDCRWPWDAPRRVDPRDTSGQRARWTVEGVATYAQDALLAGDPLPLPRTLVAAAIVAQWGYGSTAATILERHPEWDRADTDGWLEAWARPDRRERRAAWWRSRWRLRR